jgi:hypothetical protein
MRLDVLPHSTGRHPECPGDLLQCEQLQRSGHGTNSMNKTSSGTPTEIAVGSAEPMDGFRAMSGTLLMLSGSTNLSKLSAAHLADRLRRRWNACIHSVRPVQSMRSGPFVRARSAPVIELVFTPSDRVRSKTNTPWETPRFFKSIDVNPAEWDPFHLPKLCVTHEVDGAPSLRSSLGHGCSK